MSLTTAAAIYFIIWWVVLFAVLPWGVRSQVESGDVVPGSDPGAPAVPNLVAKLVAGEIPARWRRTAQFVAFRQQLPKNRAPTTNCLFPPLTDSDSTTVAPLGHFLPSTWPRFGGAFYLRLVIWAGKKKESRAVALLDGLRLIPFGSRPLWLSCAGAARSRA